jgi:hypothetical protein
MAWLTPLLVESCTGFAGTGQQLRGISGPIPARSPANALGHSGIADSYFIELRRTCPILGGARVDSDCRTRQAARRTEVAESGERPCGWRVFHDARSRSRSRAALT